MDQEMPANVKWSYDVNEDALSTNFFVGDGLLMSSQLIGM